MTGTFLGTCGWEYPEWSGRVYPKGGPADHLRYYASLFPVVEVDMTFYRRPSPRQVASWVARTPGRFRFTAKLPRTITHELRLERTDEELARFREAIHPLADSGRLACLLAQLPPSLPFVEGTVRRFYEALPADLPCAVEFREPSWLGEESIRLLREFSLAYVVVDEPLLPIRLEVTAPFAYVRWHGRGREVWYDYRYSAAELDAWVPRVRELESRSRTVYGFFNNHFRGDAVANCRELSEMLGVPGPPGPGLGSGTAPERPTGGQRA